MLHLLEVEAFHEAGVVRGIIAGATEAWQVWLGSRVELSWSRGTVLRVCFPESATAQPGLLLVVRMVSSTFSWPCKISSAVMNSFSETISDLTQIEAEA